MTTKNYGCGISIKRKGAVGLLTASLLALAAACASPEDKVERYAQEGQEFLEAGELPKAYIQFQNALKIDEAHLPSMLGLADIAEQRQDFQALYGILQNIVRLDPTQIDAQIKLGKIYLIGSDETAALEQAEKALELDPNNIDAQTLKAGVLLKIGDNAGAVELARAVIEKDPANAEAVTVLATDRSLADDHEGALEELNRALEINPRVAMLQLLRIHVLQRLGRRDETIGAYADLIELFPDEPAYRRVYAQTLARRDDLQGAREQMEAVVAIEPANLNAKLDVIRIIKHADGVEAGRAALLDYINADPDNIDLKFALVDYDMEEQGFDDALPLLDELAESDDQDAALKAKNRKAVILLQRGERDQAEAMVEEILEIDARNTPALLKQASLQIGDGEYDQAIGNLRTALDNSPDTHEAMVLMAAAFEKQGNLSFAQAEFAKAFEASDQDPDVAQQFARFLLRRKNPNRADEVLMDSLAMHPRNVENLRLLASIRLALQDWRGADEVATMLDRLESEDTLAANVKSAVYVGLGDYESVIENFERNDDQLLESQPLAALVTSYIRTNRIDEAKELLVRIIDSDADNYAARMLLARVYAQSDDSDAFFETLQNAIETAPTRPEAYELLYRLYLSRGQTDEAAALVERGLEAAPRSGAMRMFKADVLINQGRREEALELYSTMIEERPEDRIVANNFVSLSSDLRLDEESVARTLRIAKTLEDLDNPFYRDTVGWAYYRAGDYGKAVQYLKQAVEGVPQNPEMLYHLGAAQFASGNEEDSRTNLERALRLGGEAFLFKDQAQALLDRM